MNTAGDALFSQERAIKSKLAGHRGGLHRSRQKHSIDFRLAAGSSHVKRPTVRNPQNVPTSYLY